MGAADPLRDESVTDGSTSSTLVAAAVALRWSRPDLTATLAELALDAAVDVNAWAVAAGWFLHGRAAVGDGRDTVCDLLDGLDRWGDARTAPAVGPAGRRLRVEMAGAVRRLGEPALARTLLPAEADLDDDVQLRADVLTELARCAADDAPDTADDALSAAEQAWRAAASAPGIASVVLLRAARDRRIGRADLAAAQAADGLDAVHAPDRPSEASDHVAAALTAEWIAALVEAGRADDARELALPAANRLLASARPCRQVAALRLAIARIAAVSDGPELVLAALEPAAQDAADSDVPELESACRSMLGELHEHAGRLDVALAAVRAAMVAERRDRDRGARLRGRLAELGACWVVPADGGSTPPPLPRPAEPRLAPGLDAPGLDAPGLDPGAGSPPGLDGDPGLGGGVALDGAGVALDGAGVDLDGPGVDVNGAGVGPAAPLLPGAPWPPAAAGPARGEGRARHTSPVRTRQAEPVTGGRARRREAGLLDGPGLGGVRAGAEPEQPVGRGAATPGPWPVVAGGSLIGDTLMRELSGARPHSDDPDDRRAVDGPHQPGVDDTGPTRPRHGGDDTGPTRSRHGGDDTGPARPRHGGDDQGRLRLLGDDVGPDRPRLLGDDPGPSRPRHGADDRDPGRGRARSGGHDPGPTRSRHGADDPGWDRRGLGLADVGGDLGRARPRHGANDPGRDRPRHGEPAPGRSSAAGVDPRWPAHRPTGPHPDGGPRRASGSGIAAHRAPAAHERPADHTPPGGVRGPRTDARDAGHGDAGHRDAGHRDAGHGDAGHGDAGHRDAGHRDAGGPGPAPFPGAPHAAGAPSSGAHGGPGGHAAPDAPAGRAGAHATPDGPIPPPGPGAAPDGVGPTHAPGAARGTGPADRNGGRRRAPTTDADGLSLAELLAGALAAFRDL